MNKINPTGRALCRFRHEQEKTGLDTLIECPSLKRLYHFREMMFTQLKKIEFSPEIS